MMIRKITALSTIALLGACAVERGWEANNYSDEFTGARACRVELGHLRPTGYFGAYFMSFYAENRNGQIRAGVHAEPAMPIAGDVQLKVGEKLYTLTSSDAPLDMTPSMPNYSGAAQKSLGKGYAETLKSITNQTLQMASPYRAYTGARAVALLRNMAATNSEIKFRTVGINTTASTTASFKTGDGFRKALQECAIDI